MHTQKFDSIELIRQRLRDAKAGRKKSDSIAILVETLRDDIEEQRARGLTWQAVAIAMLKDGSKQAAIRSAYQRLPSKAPHRASKASSCKTRTEPLQHPPNQKTEEHQNLPKYVGFTIPIITDTTGLNGGNETRKEDEI